MFATAPQLKWVYYYLLGENMIQCGKYIIATLQYEANAFNNEF